MPKQAPKRAVVLLSGGLDSCVAATIAKCEGYDLYALTVEYGQRHAREVEAAKAVAKALRAKEHKVVQAPLAAFGGSALTERAIEVPLRRSAEEIGAGVPVTYVPARNTVFLALALAYAETADAEAIFVGANALDYSGYPDCRPAFYEAFERVAALGTKRGVEGRPTRVFAPLLEWSKADIVRNGANLRAPLHLTWSCYLGGREQCGECDACQLRRKGFREAGMEDPVPYKRVAAAKPSGPRRKG